MSQILNRVRDVDPSDSEAVKEALASFFQNLSKYKDVDCNRWLRALENVINRFPKYCGTHRQTIETYLSHFLASNSSYNVIEAAKCAHVVQQVRPSQERSATAKSCWRDQLIALCDAAHKLIDAIFINNAGNYFRNREKGAGQTIPGSSIHEALSEIVNVAGDQTKGLDRTTLLCTRLKNVMVFIQAMLVEIYPVAKPIQPQLILAVILQALSASGSEDSTNVTAIKIQALRTLDALVACLGSNLIPFSALIFRFVMQTLKWSSENSSEETRKVRIAAYHSMARWLDTLHVYRPSTEGRTRAWHDELTTHIIQDVTPAKHVMQLTMNAQPMKNMSKKARKRFANTMLKQSNIASHMPGEKNKNNLSEESNDEVAVAALECAETFLTVCGIFLNSTTHKQFQELLVRECFAIEDHTVERAMCLLHTLEACRKCCSVKVSPPTQYCMQLYSVLVNSPQREISKFCSQALLDIRLQLHCAPPSLSYALPTESRVEGGEATHKVSERNRAALEKLLGIDWMNSEELNDEVITIPDEPAHKRPRVETDEATENISLSSASDSVHSVEITSDSNESADEDVIAVIPEDSTDQAVENGMNEDDDKDERDVDTIDDERDENVVNDGDKDNVGNEKDENVVNNEKDDDSVENQKGDAIVVNARDKKISENDAEVERILIDSQNSQKVNNDVTENNGRNHYNINEAATQMPLPVSNDTVDGNKTPLSMEVAYDYPNTGNDKVNVLEKMDDENLPSTNDTDDIQITCGQVVKYSQDDAEKNKETPKLNGTNKTPDIELDIDTDNKENEQGNDVTTKMAHKNTDVTVADMLADFVDEVDEESEP